MTIRPYETLTPAAQRRRDFARNIIEAKSISDTEKYRLLQAHDLIEQYAARLGVQMGPDLVWRRNPTIAIG